MVLSVGELLVDMISTNYAETFDEVTDFKRIPGGSPGNMCMNMARLGVKTALVAGVGNDDMGQYLIDYVASTGVDIQHIEKKNVPTTMILVTRSTAVSNFEAYRFADLKISAKQLNNKVLEQHKIFHTTCFALSKNPAQRNILDAARRASELGLTMSIDANYAQKIWPNQAEAQQLVKNYVGLGALVKISEVDWQRLYNEPLTDANVVADHFLGLGASEVCVTLGGDGCMVANKTERHFLAARPVEVKDTTGAGDAFWSGYLTAWLDDKTLIQKALAGRRIAELKLAHFGPLPGKVDRNVIYEDF
jgi:sugar/nucleoside kinase (ribokinase family)